MFNYITSYYPVDSRIHKLNPIVKLVSLLLLLICIIGSNTLKLHIVISFFIVVLIYISKVPFKYFIDSIYGLRYIYLLLIFLLASKGLYLNDAVVLLIKITYLMVYLSLIFYTTTSSELKYGLEKLLNPLNIFNINLSPVINKLVNLLTFFPVLFITEREVLNNASARGLDYIYTDILTKIIVRFKNFKNTFRLTKEKLNKVKLSSILRSYSTKKYRTIYSSKRIGFFDILYLLIHLYFVFFYIMERGLL